MLKSKWVSAREECSTVRESQAKTGIDIVSYVLHAAVVFKAYIVVQKAFFTTTSVSFTLLFCSAILIEKQKMGDHERARICYIRNSSISCKRLFLVDHPDFSFYAPTNRAVLVQSPGVG